MCLWHMHRDLYLGFFLAKKRRASDLCALFHSWNDIEVSFDGESGLGTQQKMHKLFKKIPGITVK